MLADPAGHTAPGFHRMHASTAHQLLARDAAFTMHQQGSLLELEQDVSSRSQVLSPVFAHLALV